MVFILLTDSRFQEAEAKRSAINQEALALSLAYTNAVFLAAIVVATFFVFRFAKVLAIVFVRI
jgi:hypothetical protein